jgi:hypothetical protein
MKNVNFIYRVNVKTKSASGQSSFSYGLPMGSTIADLKREMNADGIDYENAVITGFGTLYTDNNALLPNKNAFLTVSPGHHSGGAANSAIRTEMINFLNANKPEGKPWQNKTSKVLLEAYQELLEANIDRDSILAMDAEELENYVNNADDEILTAVYEKTQALAAENANETSLTVNSSEFIRLLDQLLLG